jgi:hypothetical protein
MYFLSQIGVGVFFCCVLASGSREEDVFWEGRGLDSVEVRGAPASRRQLLLNSKFYNEPK